MTRPPSPSLKPSKPKSKLIFEQCRTSVGGTKQLKSNTTLILTTPRIFSLKTVFGSSASSSVPLLSSDGKTLIKDQEGLRKRWWEHFSTLLNRPSSVDSDTLNQIPQQHVRVSLVKPPTIKEIKKTIHQTISGRASRKDSTPAEIYKAVGPDTHGAFHDVLLTVWKEEMMPDDCRDAQIISLYKKKGSKSDCGTYRGISFLSVAGKDFAQVILNRLITVSKQTLPEAQSSFRPNRSTVDVIFAVRQLQEKCIEQKKPRYSVFIDPTKAFETINREALWTVLECIGCPPKSIVKCSTHHSWLDSLCTI